MEPPPTTKNDTTNIGLVFPTEFGNEYLTFFLESMLGVHQECQHAGYDVILITVSKSDISNLERIVHENKIDGAILERTYKNDIAAELLIKDNIPFVTIGENTDKSILFVDQDNYSSCCDMTETLISTGNRRLFLIGSDAEFIVNNDRFAAFTDTCAKAKARGKIDEYSYFMNATNTRSVSVAVREAFRMNSDLIICMDDNVSVLTLNELDRRNVKVPEEIKLASFFNSQYLEEHHPSVTSIVYDNRGLGSMAASLLLQKLCEGAVSENEQIKLRYELAIRESTK